MRGITEGGRSCCKVLSAVLWIGSCTVTCSQKGTCCGVSLPHCLTSRWELREDIEPWTSLILTQGFPLRSDAVSVHVWTGICLPLSAYNFWPAPLRQPMREKHAMKWRSKGKWKNLNQKKDLNGWKWMLVRTRREQNVLENEEMWL